MTVRRSGSGAHRLMGLCALILMLACAVMGTAATASAAVTAVPGQDGGPPAATDGTLLSAAPAARQADGRASDGDGAPRCSGSAQAPEPVLAPRQQPELTQPGAVTPPAPALPAVPLADRAHPPAHGSPARPPDLAQLSVLRI